VSSLEGSKSGDLTFCVYDSINPITETDATAVLCEPEQNIGNVDSVLLFVERPRLAMNMVYENFFHKRRTGISESATICDGAILGNNCYIGPDVTVRDSVEIGDRCEIRSGAVIGSPGYGYEIDNTGSLHPKPHEARVIIGDDVVIGSNTVIERGVFSDTVINSGSKIQNNTSIAHNSFIGQSVFINSNVSVNGSVRVGDYSRVHPGVNIGHHCQLGEGAEVGIGSTVIEDVEDYSLVVGSPARRIGDSSRKELIGNKNGS
jgi:UDP-3-O-[3-hydroxymyristoyl] glucosamine N-acyltransferase